MTEQQTNDGLISFDKFLETSGLSHVTGWRYRQRGWLKTLNIAGRHYIERAEIARFMERARAGEFAKTPSRPRRTEGAK
jgi:hypothetical protein